MLRVQAASAPEEAIRQHCNTLIKMLRRANYRDNIPGAAATLRPLSEAMADVCYCAGCTGGTAVGVHCIAVGGVEPGHFGC